MKAVLQSKPGGIATLSVGEIEKPLPFEGQMLVRVKAAGVNRADIIQREGHYPAPPGASLLLGLEVAGVVEEGRALTRFKPGDAVFGLVSGGGYAQYVLLDEALAIAKPEFLSWVDAASLPEAWMTVWLNLIEIGALKENEQVLIHAGASGVGAAALQLVRLWGAHAVASAGSTNKLAFCQRLGAKHGFNWREWPHFASLVRQWGGADLILDPVGGGYLAQNIYSLNVDGRLIVIGVMGGREAEVDVAHILTKRLTVRGSTLRHQAIAVKARLAQALEEHILAAIAAGIVDITVDAVYPLAEVAQAHQHIESNCNMGKVVLVVD